MPASRRLARHADRRPLHFRSCRHRPLAVDRLRIGTRGSALALAQTGQIAARLEAQGVATETVVIRTSGDRLADVSLAKLGGKGLFIKELEEALAAGEIDVAVHSMKD